MTTEPTIQELIERVNALSITVYQIQYDLWAKAWSSGRHPDAPEPPVMLPPVALDGKKPA